jgi:hypothetical protein
MSLTKVSYSMINGAPFNVSDYPSVSAADTAAALVNGTLVFSAGTYTLSSDITFASNVVMLSGAKIITSNKLIFSNGFSAPLEFCLDASGYVQFASIVQVYPQWFNAMGDAVYCACSIASGSSTLTCSAPSGAVTPGFNNGDTIYVLGAGVAGSILQTTIVSGAGTLTLTLGSPASTTVTSSAAATRNNTESMKRFFASMKGAANTSVYGAQQPSNSCTKLYLPAGSYCVFDYVYVYNGCVVEGEFGNTIGGTRIVQCDISKPALTVIADNFNSAGGSINGGNGNNIFRNLGFASANINDALLNAPALYFQNAWNIHSDTELDHCLFQSTAGACVGAGFETTGTITSGSTTLTLANGSTFRSNGSNIGGSRITIVGAGVAGADLVTYIVSGGGTNTVTLAVAASTSVTGALVYPTAENFGIKVNDCEFDVCRTGFEFRGGLIGSLVVTNHIAYNVVRGLVRNISRGDFNITISNSILNGCGNSFNSTADYRRSIYFNSGLTTNGSLTIFNTTIDKIGAGAGGPIYFIGKSINVANCELYDLDTNDLQKFMLVVADQIKITVNTFRLTSLNDFTNSRIISFSNPTNPASLDCSGNTFLNLGVGTVSRWIHSDYGIQSRSFVNNKFIGASSLVFDTNISFYRNYTNGSQGYSGWQNYGTAAPASGNYAAGDIVWNVGITNAAGQAVGFVCVVGGTPGTWRSFGVTI